MLKDTGYSAFHLGAIQRELVKIGRAGMPIPQECILFNGKPLYIEQKAFDSIYHDADEIGKILFSILKKTKINQQ